MYIKIKQLYQRETMMIAGLNIFIGLSFFATFARTAAPADEAELHLMQILSAAAVLLILYGIISAVLRTGRWNKMLRSLGCMSDEDAQWMLSHAEPMDKGNHSALRIVPRIYIKEDRIINFTNAKTYEIRKISRMKKRAYNRPKSIKMNYGMEVMLSCSPYHDRVILTSMEERDAAYEKIASVYERYGGDRTKL